MKYLLVFEIRQNMKVEKL